MADIEYTRYGQAQDMEDAQRGGGIGRLINMAGGLASLVLVAGVAVWGYQLLMRDVSGVPVVRALEGPMRMQPENPGGQQADHQGLAVNAVAARGTAEAPAERLMLAPRPVDLSAEDKPMPVLAAERADAEEEEQAEGMDPSIEALVAQLAGGVKPVTVPDEGGERLTQAAAAIEQPAPLEPLSADDLVQPEPAVLSGPGLPRSLRPVKRPARALAAASAEAAPEEEEGDTSADVREIDAESLPAGTRLAQLGAFDSPDVARQEWERLSGRFEDYLDGKARVIQKAASGGRTFYRLRAMGFDDINDARRFCSMLVAENADCIPVTTR